HYAGHYRGEDFDCLRDYAVRIAINPRVGHLPNVVPAEMDEFKDMVCNAVSRIDAAWSVEDRILPRSSKIRRLSELVAAVFNYFLEIHPYANGNGHIARL